MNVKPGDRARVVAPYAMPGRGAYVLVKRPAVTWEILDGHLYGCFGGPGWVVEGWVRDCDGERQGPFVVVGDTCLRRIDPDPEQADESDHEGADPDVRLTPMEPNHA